MALKLVGLFALILPAVIGTPWKLEAHSDDSYSENNRDNETPFSIEETVLGGLQANDPSPYWINDEQLEMVGFAKKYVVTALYARVGLQSVILPATVLGKYNTTKYKFSPDRKLVLIKYDESKVFRISECARYAVYSLEKKTFFDLAKKELLDAAEWGPNDNSIVYIKNNNIYLATNIDTREETFRITTNGIPGKVFNGRRNWIDEGAALKEEVLSSGRAFWVSPNGKELVYLSIDDSNVTSASFPTYGEPRKLSDQYVKTVNIRYPKAGSRIPDYGLWHVTLSPLSKPKLLTKKEAGKEVFYNLQWISNDTVMYLQTNRVQNVSRVFTQNINNPKEKKMVFEHKNPVGWANLKLPRVSKDGQKMVRIEGRPSGKLGNFNHLVLYSVKNGTSHILAGGAPIDIIDIVHWDEEYNFVYYTAAKNNTAIETHVYEISEEKNSTPECVTCKIRAIDNSLCKAARASFSPSSELVMVQCLGPNPNSIFILENEPPFDWAIGRLDSNARFREKLKTKLFPEVNDLQVDIGGSLKADVRLYVPPNIDKTGKTKYPLVIYVYGGPASKNINDVFKLDWHHYMTTNLSVVYGIIDGRNTLRKGENMLFAGYRALGTVEMQDQINVTRYLQKTYPFIDPKRTGIWGWSYGGYATTKILEIDTSNVFKCGIAVAPVADWMYYHSVYTERYMGLPQENPKGYEKSSVLHDVQNLRNKKYLLIHGNADDNVHYQNAMMIAKVLERNNIPFESMSYPDEDHSLKGVKPHLYYTMDRFWKNCFGLKQ